VLVLGRYRGEQVVIEVPPSDRPRRVVVTTCEVRGDHARIGFDADRDITIHRGEVQAERDARRLQQEPRDGIQRAGPGESADGLPNPEPAAPAATQEPRDGTPEPPQPGPAALPADAGLGPVAQAQAGPAGQDGRDG
jgi:sRNA-binding carbon storage regulator CsrA